MMESPKVLFVEKAKEKYREREPKKNIRTAPKTSGPERRRGMRFLPTGLFGELEHRQGLRAIKRVLRG